LPSIPASIKNPQFADLFGLLNDRNDTAAAHPRLLGKVCDAAPAKSLFVADITDGQKS
jgi:hypothetical protein